MRFDRPLLLDAAMGTALIAAGLKGRAPGWNLLQPQIVQNVHFAHVRAGAEVVLTNTFVGASPEESTTAVRLARESGAKYVAGSFWAGLPELGDQIAQLEGVDCIWLESAISAQQALTAVRAAVQATSLPVVITCAMQAAPLDDLRAAGAAAVGYNCSPWPLDLKGADIWKPDAAGLEPQEWARRIGGKALLLGGCCGTDDRYLAALCGLRATAR
ncbi:MAG: homocysteine S-methyltransferase family protein [Deltaproteobacteria bacterium]|nr:MAG: homocysteine S-methyltransferase family protein [Deltaproteobacteria bacterium]